MHFVINLGIFIKDSPGFKFLYWTFHCNFDNKEIKTMNLKVGFEFNTPCHFMLGILWTSIPSRGE